MILYHWRGSEPNFGDELNHLLWPILLPNFFDQDATTCFLGIGSILDNRHHHQTTKLVAGSGYGGYESPIVPDETWIIQWVRGPRTARQLGLPPSMGIGDPASLVAHAGLTEAVNGSDIGFIPHFESMGRGAWTEVAALAGVTLIDPRHDPAAVMAAISRCRMVLSEALHGIIVADALRVPWVAIQPLAPIHRPKWTDWAETLELAIVFRTLCPSSALEWAHLSQISRYHFGRGVLHQHAARMRCVARERYIHQAAEALRTAVRAEPQLSRDAMLDTAQMKMLELIGSIRGVKKS
jgi:succinoglycan biosynthesis protein ExoV